MISDLMSYLNAGLTAKNLYNSNRYKVAYELPNGNKSYVAIRGGSSMSAVDSARVKVPEGKNFRAFKTPEQDDQLDNYMNNTNTSFSLINYTKQFGFLGPHQTAIATGLGAVAGGALMRSMAKKRAYKAAIAKGMNPAQAEDEARRAGNRAMVGGALAGAAIGNAGSRFANSWQETSKANPDIKFWDHVKASGKGVGQSYKNDWNNNEGWWNKTKAIVGVNSNPTQSTNATT